MVEDIDLSQGKASETRVQAAGGGGAIKGAATALLLLVVIFGLWSVDRPDTSTLPDTSTPSDTRTPGPNAAGNTASGTIATALPTPTMVTPNANGTARAANTGAGAAKDVTTPDRIAETGAAGADPGHFRVAGPIGTEMAAREGQASDTASGQQPDTDERAAQDAQAPVRFDALRATADGSVMLAGRVAPGARLQVLLNGQQVAKGQADESGNFATLFDVEPAARPRALSLKVTGADGVPREGAQSLILHPTVEAEPGDDGAAPGPVVADASGARDLVPEPNRPDSNGPDSDSMVIDTIRFGSGEAARAEGRGAPERDTLMAYLDNRLVARTRTETDGRWHLDLPELTGGAHRLRIDAADPQGRIVARAEARFDQPDQILVADATMPAQKAAEQVARTGGTGDAVKVVQIVKGNTLWAIARQVYGHGILYVRVFNANRDQIRDPDLIYPGQVFTIPAAQ